MVMESFSGPVLKHVGPGNAQVAFPCRRIRGNWYRRPRAYGAANPKFVMAPQARKSATLTQRVFEVRRIRGFLDLVLHPSDILALV